MNEVEKRTYTVAVDLGTTNVVVIVGAKMPDGTLHFRSLVAKRMQAGGMQAGQIINKVAVGNSIRAALTEIEADLGTRISQVYTGISGSFIRCENYTDHVFAQDSQGGISQQDVDALYARMEGVQAPENEIIIERIPQNFKIDGRLIDGQNLVGAFGRPLSATVQFVLCERTPLERLHTLFDELGIKVLGVYPTMLSIVEAVATPEEREDGVAVVNLGGDKTDMAVIHGNTLRYITSIPIGGAAINDDIYTMSIPRTAVEDMKRRYGSAIAEKTERKQLIIPGRRPNGGAATILDCHLATAIEARMLDIIDYVKEELQESGYGKRLGYGLILAGGGSRLANVDELFRRETGLEVRLAATDQVNRDKNEPESKPAYATAQGILMRGIKDGRSEIVGNVRSRVEAATEAAAGARDGRQQEEPVAAPVEERSQRVAPTAPATPATPAAAQPARAAAAPQRPNPLTPRPEAPRPTRQPAQQPAVQQPAGNQAPQQQRQPLPATEEAADNGTAETAAADDAAEQSGSYGPIGVIKGVDDSYDDPERELADDEEKREGWFKRKWNALKEYVDGSFNENEDTSFGSDKGSDW